MITTLNLSLLQSDYQEFMPMDIHIPYSCDRYLAASTAGPSVPRGPQSDASTDFCNRRPDVPKTVTESAVPLSFTGLIREAEANTEQETLRLQADIIHLREKVDALRRGETEQLPPPQYA